MPLAFASGEDIKTVEVDDHSRMKDEIRAITAQNELVNALYGSDLNVFEARQSVLVYENCELSASPDWFNSMYHAVNMASPVTFTYTYVCEDDRPVYFEQNFKNGTMTVKVNDKESAVDMLTEPFKYVGSYPAGTEITVTVEVQNSGGSGKYGLDFFVLDPARWQRAYTVFSNSGLQVSSFTSTKITGTMSAMCDTAVFTSIPQDNGWKVYVDGKKVETYLIAGALVGFDLPAGTHDVTFRYNVPGYTPGLIVTILSLSAVVFCMWRRRCQCVYAVNVKNKRRSAFSKRYVKDAQTAKSDTAGDFSKEPMNHQNE